MLKKLLLPSFFRNLPPPLWLVVCFSVINKFLVHLKFAAANVMVAPFTAFKSHKIVKYQKVVVEYQRVVE